MDKNLRNTFAQLKSKCITKAQRIAFNHLIKSFNSGSLDKDTNIIKAMLPMDIITMILQDSENLIKGEDLVFTDNNSILGRECDPHITLYIDINPEIARELLDDLYTTLPIKCTISDISSFDKPEYKVIKYGISSNQLDRIYNELKSKYNIESDYDEFNPHITLAYVKPTVETPRLSDSNLNGVSFQITEFAFNNRIITGVLS